jgi:hypothetical protein
MNYGLRRGYAASTMDGGHWGTGSADGRWAADRRPHRTEHPAIGRQVAGGRHLGGGVEVHRLDPETLLSDAPGFTNAMNYGLRRGYAASTMDGGHWGTGSADGRRWSSRRNRISAAAGRRRPAPAPC